MNLARLLITAGVLLVILGLVVLGLAKLNVPFGKLPGDIVWRGKNTTVYFPWVTCVVISAVVTLILWLIGRR